MANQQLYLVHLGYYDPEISNGVYESHTNLFVTGESFEDARRAAKELELVKKYRMHIDGLQRVEMVNGCEIRVGEKNGEATVVTPHHFRELAPKK